MSNNRKWKGREKEMQRAVDINGVAKAAKMFDSSEKTFRVACYNYGIKIPPRDGNMTEDHPKIRSLIAARQVWLSRPWR